MKKPAFILFILLSSTFVFAHHPADSARAFFTNEQHGNYVLNIEAQETVGNTLVEIEVVNEMLLTDTNIILTATNIYNSSQQVRSLMTRVDNRFESNLDLSKSRWQITADIAGSSGEGQLEFVVEPKPTRVNPPVAALIALSQIALVSLVLIMSFYYLQTVKLFEPVTV